MFSRRGFLSLVAGAGAGIVATPVIWKGLDDISIWSQNWSWIPSLQPGEDGYVHVVSNTCPSHTAMRVRLVGKRPVRTLPIDNDSHPLGGGLTALAAAEVQLLYSESRLSGPMKRTESGEFVQISWDEAAQLFAAKVKEVRGSSAFISGTSNSTSIDLISAFANTTGSSDVFLMPSASQTAAKAANILGLDAQVGYNLEQSDVILAINANLLESWGTVVRNRHIINNARPKKKLIYAGPVKNQTALLADFWAAINPGGDGALLGGLLAMILNKKFGTVPAQIAQFSPEAVSQTTGLSPETLNSVCDSLLQAKLPLVIVDSKDENLVACGLLVNFALGSDNYYAFNNSAGMVLLPQLPTPVDKATNLNKLYANDLVSWFNDDKEMPQILITHEANPLYALPNQQQVKKKFAAIPFKITFASQLNETAAESDLVLPTPMGLERLDDITTPYGSGIAMYCVSPPASQPTHDVRSVGNFLLTVSRILLADGAIAESIIPENTSYEKLIEQRAALLSDRFSSKSFDVMLTGTPSLIISNLMASLDSKNYVNVLGSLDKHLQKTDADNTKLPLAICSKLNLGTPVTGIPPFNTKTIRSDELRDGFMSVLMNKKTADARHLKEGDLVTLTSDTGSLQAKVHLSESIVSDAIALFHGFGHTAFDAFSQNKGANVMALVSAPTDPDTNTAVWNQTAVVISKA